MKKEIGERIGESQQQVSYRLGIIRKSYPELLTKKRTNKNFCKENMNMTKESFANKMGISGQYLGLIEHGKNYLSIEKLKVLCDFTNLSADYILFGKDKNIINDTKDVLSKFSQEQIEVGCDILKKLAILINDN